MAAVTDTGATTASTANQATYASGSFTPAAGDLLVVLVAASGTVDAGAITVSANGVTSMTRVDRSTSTTSTHSQYIFVADQLVGASPSSMTVTFDCTGDDATGAIVMVARVSGMTKTGATAILQSTKVDNGAGSTTPTFTFGASCQTGNPTLVVLGQVSSGGSTPPTNWTEAVDTSIATPTYGGTYVFRDSGFTGTTITWGDVETAHGGVAVELDASSSGTTHQLAATGTGTTTGSAALIGTLAVSATGSGTTTGSAALTGTLALSASGSGTTGGSAALIGTLQLSATGSGTTGGSAAITIVGTATTHQLTATGSGTTGGSAALRLTGALSASGTGQTGGSATLSLRGALSASGDTYSRGSADLTFVTFKFSPPTHEEPMWVNKRPLNYYRITESSSIVRINGVLTTVRHPRPDQIAAAGVEGVDYFLGGREYVITGGVRAELISAGYSA